MKKICIRCDETFEARRINREICDDCKRYEQMPHTFWIEAERKERNYKYFERCKDSARRRREKVRGLSHTYTPNEWKHKVHSCKGKCPSCNKEAKLTLDHIIPVSKAPEDFIYTIDDVQPLCKGCNSQKGGRLNWKGKRN